MRSTAELSGLHPCTARASSRKKSHADILQMIPALGSTHWCPARRRKHSCPQAPPAQGQLPTLTSLSDGSSSTDKRPGASPGRCDQPVAPGASSCSRAQGRAQPSSGLSKEFSPSAHWHCSPQVFCLPLQHSAPPLAPAPPVPLAYLPTCCSCTTKMASLSRRGFFTVC